MHEEESAWGYPGVQKHVSLAVRTAFAVLIYILLSGSNIIPGYSWDMVQYSLVWIQPVFSSH